MEININKIDEATRELTIVVPKTSFEQELEAEFKNAQRYILFKGFRKGRVPLQLIKQLYGKEIESDFIGEYATKLFKDATEKDKIKYIGKPIFKDLKKGEDTVAFVFFYDVIPDIELKEYKGLKIYEPVHRVSDKEIEHEIDHRRLYSANVRNAEEIKTEFSIVAIDIIPLNQDTLEPLEGGKVQSTTILLSSETVPQDLKALLIGRRVGDEFNYNPGATEPSAPNEVVKIRINNVSELELEEFNDEFVKKYTHGRLSTTEEFKEEIGYFLQEKWDMRSNDEMVKQVIKQLVEAHEFDLPQTVVNKTALKLSEDFIKKYRDSYPQIRDKKPEDLLADFIPIAESQVKWSIIKRKIVEKENLQIEDYDIETIVEEHKRQNPNASDEDIKNYIKNSPHIVETLLEKKTLDFLIGFAETEEIDFDEYLKMVEEKEHAHHHHESELNFSVEDNSSTVENLNEQLQEEIEESRENQ